MYYRHYVRLSEDGEGNLINEKNTIEYNGNHYVIKYLSDQQKRTKGGNSSVYRVKDPNNSEPDRVIKICRYFKPYRGTPAHIKQRHGRFINEIDALNRAKDQGFNNIIEIHFDGILEVDGNPFPYFVMEKADTDLGDFLMNNSLDEQERVSFMVQIFGAIKQLHSMDIYHRDIKPDNVFVFYQSDDDAENSKFTWKIGDLGLIAYRDKEFDKTGEKIGPFGFVSPEVMNKTLTEKKDLDFDCEIDDYSDVFQLGLLFWFIIQNNIPLGQVAKDDFVADIQNRDMIFELIYDMIQHSKDRRIHMEDLSAEISELKKEYAV